MVVNPIPNFITLYIGDSSGNIELWRKTESAQQQISCHKRWANVHNLGIVQLCLVISEKLLASIGFSCTCRISCSETGSIFYTISNPSSVMYTGVCWHERRDSFFLTDEVGYFEEFNVATEKSQSRQRVLSPRNPKHVMEIKTAHKDPLFSAIAPLTDSVVLTLIPVPDLSRADAAALDELPHGEVAAWKLYEDQTLREFVAHEHAVVCMSLHPSSTMQFRQPMDPASASSVALPRASAASAAAGVAAVSSTSLTSAQEQRLFSVDSHTFRCWDLRDCKQSFERPLKIKGLDGIEVTCALTVWPLNSTAVGYEDGTVALWHNDAGSRVTSRKLKDAVTCVVEARKLQAHVLVVSDFSGKVSVFNLTLLSAHPGDLPLDISFQGPHSLDDPSILSIAYHEDTRAMISAGTDQTIRFFRLDSEATSLAHTFDDVAPTCSLHCTQSFLLAGDERGGLVLFKIVEAERPSSSSLQHLESPSLPSLVPLCQLRSEFMASTIIPALAASSSLPAVCALWQTSRTKAVVVQGGVGSTLLWEVRTKRRKERDPSKSDRERREAKERAADDEAEAKGEPETKEAASAEPKTSSRANALRVEIDSAWDVLFRSQDANDKVTVSLAETFSHASLQASVVAVGNDEGRPGRLGCVFVGTMEGQINCFSV